MIENQNISNDVTVEEKNDSGNITYELSPQDFAALTATATTLYLQINETLRADTCVCCPERAEHWFKLITYRTANYSFSANTSTHVSARLYNDEGTLVASDNVDGEESAFLIDNYTLLAGYVYYLRVTSDHNTFNRFNTVIIGAGIPVESIRVTPSTLSLKTGETAILSEVITPEIVTNKQVVWSSSNPNVATVNANGKVLSKRSGVATISAIATDGTEKQGQCSVRVEPMVTGISLNRSSKILSLDETEQLTVNITPSNALNKNVTWNSSNWSVVHVNNDGLITGINFGTATISAISEDGGFVATCVVTVDARPKVVIEKDEEYSLGDIITNFNIIFDDGKIWHSVGCDLSLDENRSGIPLGNLYEKDYMTIPEQRYVTNKQIAYSAKQLAFIYLCDPYGVDFYLRHYDTVLHSKTLAELLWFKDEVFKEIFGCWPRLIKVFPDQSVSYYDYSRTMSDSDREDYWTDAEILFGEHPIYDWLTIAELAYNVLNTIAMTILGIVSPELAAIIAAVDLTKALFFNGAIEDAIANGESAGLELYVEDIINSSTTNQAVRDGLQARFGAVTAVVGVLATIIQTGVFMPTSDELSVCNKINSEEMRASFAIEDEELSIQEILDRYEN